MSVLAAAETSETSSRPLRRLRIGRVLRLVAIVVLLIALGAPLGLRLLVVEGGSMSPTYAVGDVLLIAEPTGDDLAPGASVVVGEGAQRYVHRVVETDGDRARLRGDANTVTDPGWVTEEDVTGTVAAHIARPAAALIVAVTSLEGRISLVLLLALALAAPLIGRSRAALTPSKDSDAPQALSEERPSSLRGSALGALALVAAALATPLNPHPGTVGAFFSDGASVQAASVQAATIPPLGDGRVERDGTTAYLRWATPAQAGGYSIERTIGGVTTSLSPTLTSEGGTTSFADSLAISPSDGACPAGWALGSSDVCVPGVPASYRIGHVVSGWSPPDPLVLTVSPAPSPSITTTGSHNADVFRLGVHITNPSSVHRTYTVRFPASIPGSSGRLVNIEPDFTGHVEGSVWSATITIPAGETRTGSIAWRAAQGGDLITLTTSDGVSPQVVTTVIVP